MHLEARIQEADFDVAQELTLLRGDAEDGAEGGAVVSFIGLVRGNSTGFEVRHLLLEHYEGMTQRYLRDIATRAGERWPVLATRIVHRVGRIERGKQIVFVATMASHRQDAFQACAYIMDHLKTEAPLWKAEYNGTEHRWVHACTADKEHKKKWHQK